MKHTGNPLIDTSTADYVLGSDEVGYGAWAGSLVVCAVLLPRTWNEPGVGDSKTLSPERRRAAYLRWTKTVPVPHNLVEVSPKRIDELGVGQALVLAHRNALRGLLTQATGSILIVVDGFPHGTEAIGIEGAIGLPKADSLIPAVSLASIIAKVTRDEMMVRAGDTYKGYGFAKNSGYGVKFHSDALEKLGPCDIHRRSYEPVKRAIAERAPCF